jgi:hypothetical protein
MTVNRKDFDKLEGLRLSSKNQTWINGNDRESQDCRMLIAY